jgi:hypothetical protein
MAKKKSLFENPLPWIILLILFIFLLIWIGGGFTTQTQTITSEKTVEDCPALNQLDCGSMGLTEVITIDYKGCQINMCE